MKTRAGNQAAVSILQLYDRWSACDQQTVRSSWSMSGGQALNVSQMVLNTSILDLLDQGDWSAKRLLKYRLTIDSQDENGEYLAFVCATWFVANQVLSLVISLSYTIRQSRTRKNRNVFSLSQCESWTRTPLTSGEILSLEAYDDGASSVSEQILIRFHWMKPTAWCVWSGSF